MCVCVCVCVLLLVQCVRILKEVLDLCSACCLKEKYTQFNLTSPTSNHSTWLFLL